jgi:hypothetical protein
MIRDVLCDSRSISRNGVGVDDKCDDFAVGKVVRELSS